MHQREWCPPSRHTHMAPFEEQKYPTFLCSDQLKKSKNKTKLSFENFKKKSYWNLWGMATLHVWEISNINTHNTIGVRHSLLGLQLKNYILLACKPKLAPLYESSRMSLKLSTLGTMLECLHPCQSSCFTGRCTLVCCILNISGVRVLVTILEFVVHTPTHNVTRHFIWKLDIIQLRF